MVQRKQFLGAQKDLYEGMRYEGGDITVLELVKKYVDQKRGVRHNTKANYNFVINIIAKEEFGQLISSFTGQFTRGKWLAVGTLFLIWIYFTSKGIMHYDSDLYHAQSIRWIEEYGVVKGLGNLQVRFASTAVDTDKD